MARQGEGRTVITTWNPRVTFELSAGHSPRMLKVIPFVDGKETKFRDDNAPVWDLGLCIDVAIDMVDWFNNQVNSKLLTLVGLKGVAMRHVFKLLLDHKPETEA